MSESTLSLKYSDLQAEVGGFLGYGVDPSAWSAEKAAEVDRYIQSGLRQFYYPPAVNGIEAAYEWSFLKPTATITTAVGDAEQDLPDALGRILGDLHFDVDVHNVPIVQVSEARILALLQQSESTGKPQYAAVRSKASDGTTGQRLEIAWWPIPDAAYILTYRYEAFAGKLTGSKQYPLGGMRHSELIVESCLAVAEQKANDEKGIHTERFMELLASGIAQDRKAGARYYGHMGAQEDDVVTRGQARGDSYPVTYKGATW